jgi:hypothetical protein
MGTIGRLLDEESLCQEQPTEEHERREVREIG